MPAYSFPSAPDERFEEFLRKSERLKGEALAAAIPRECFEPRVWRGLLGFAVSATLYLGALAGLLLAPSPLLWIPLWIVAGLGGWGLHCIAHDCGHGAFSRSRRFNVAIGHVALLPLLYPYHAWRHVHYMHHSHTNHLELDTDWTPLPHAVYLRLPAWRKAIYAASRTWAFWGGTINYWRVSAFRPSFFPTARMRRDVRRSIGFVLVVGVPSLAALAYLTGLRGVIVLLVLPWVATHVWFSATTLMHHSAGDVPYVTAEHWTPNASRLLATTDYAYPRWLSFMTHNISIHTPHHVAPVIPFYNLRRAQDALKATYPGMLRERKLSPRQLWRIVRRLHCYDTESGYYADLSGRPVRVDEPAARSEARR